MNIEVPHQGKLFEQFLPVQPKSVEAKKDLPPMLQHYLEVKNTYPDRLVFYQVGDFFEVFFDDAYVVSDCLSIRLTSRDKDQENPVPMCGLPIHAFHSYVPKLINAGHSCIIIEQVEDSSQSKGLVKRAITKIITPGVSFDNDSSASNEINFILSILSSGGSKYCLCAMEASTGKVILHANVEEIDLLGIITKYCPKEVLLSAKSQVGIQQKLTDLLHGIFPFKVKFSSFDCDEIPFSDLKSNIILSDDASFIYDSMVNELAADLKECLKLLLLYVRDVSKCEKILVSSINLADQLECVSLEGSTIRNLELISSYDGSRDFSLLGILDKARTAIGSRQLKEWIVNPSSSILEIEQRLDAVSLFIDNTEELENLRQQLYEIRDLERLCTKLISGKVSPYDLGILLQSLKVIPVIKSILGKEDFKNSKIETLSLKLLDISELVNLLENSLLEDLPIRLGEGPVFKETYNEELSKLKSLERDSKKIVSEMEFREKEETGINNLRIKHNSVLGYFIEISINNTKKVPDRYTKRQTLSNVERYYTQELKDLEKEIFAASSKIDSVEKNLFLGLKMTALTFVNAIQSIGKNIGIIDALGSFAVVSKENEYIRPKISTKKITKILKGRHPVVEKAIGRAKFVPNDLTLDLDGKYFSVLTGPNMGGKSTYLRQIGVIQVMAQMGCFVPAALAELGLIDQIYTRIGSGDSLAKGDSTFMVEMKEAAKIVLSASDKSLVLIDELGRGTATKDGFSLAMSVSEWLIENIKSRTIFATHFHELTTLEKKYEQVRCLSVGIIETASRIEFTHRIEHESTEKSYGIHVAKLAGLPLSILQRANEIFLSASKLEYKSEDCTIDQSRFETAKKLETLLSFVEVVSKIKPDEISPKEALSTIYELSKWIKDFKDSH